MVYIGVDLGGTNIAVGVVDNEGKILEEGSTPTLVGRPFGVIVKDIADCISDTLTKANISIAQVESIGIGIPGIADLDTGVVLFCTNLGWRNEPLRTELQKHINKPVYLGNDATVAGYAESIAGVSAGCSSSVFLTLGTGVGGGIVIDGKPWSGFHGVGSEIGHITLDIDGILCTCGKRGCLERYCSATAVIRMGKEAILMNPDTLMNEMCGYDPSRLNAKMVFDAAKQGDEVAGKVFRRYAKYMAIAINTIISFFDPEMIVLGGGISKAGSFLVDAINEEIGSYILFEDVPVASIEIARLGSSAGIIGAAMLGR